MDESQVLIDEHDAEVEQASEKLENKTSPTIRKAEVALLLYLAAHLSIKHGRVEQNVANMLLLQETSQKFSDLLLEYGFDDSVREFMRHFNQQRGFFESIVKSFKAPHLPTFTEDDLKLLNRKKQAAASKLIAVQQQVAEEVQDWALTSMGAPLADLQEQVTQVIAKLGPKLKRIGRTELFRFYRGLAAIGYESIQAQTPGTPLLYGYFGPSSGDPVIRVFCRRLRLQMEAGRTWTRQEIDAMDNGQLPNVFETCGGYECRHQFGISTGQQRG